MQPPNACPQCGAELSADAAYGVCPRCLLGQNLFGGDSFGEAPDTTAPRPRGSAPAARAGRGFRPPTPEELADFFPQLEIVALVGQGGMGAVYKARQRGLDRVVALKILAPAAAEDEQFSERFHREARALARLKHPHIVGVYDSGKSGPYFFLLMEFVDGVNLRQAMQSGKVRPAQALEMVAQICDALQYAHDERVVHRDIKPENVLLDAEGRVKVADFGLAKMIDPNVPDFTLTATHQVMGTPRYMAPEQLEGARDVDHRADIYSLGVVFYELLTGELPLGRFAAPSKRVQVDVRLDEVVLRTLEKHPEQRYQQAHDLRTDVDGIRSGTYSRGGRRGGYEYRSAATLFGIPLLHIANGIDPATGRRRTAIGFVAIGDRAIGGVAIGGVTAGIVSIGGLAIGLLSLSGLAIGLLAFGGVAIGGVAAGGLSAGYYAAGGLAIGAHPVGGLPIALAPQAGTRRARDFPNGGPVLQPPKLQPPEFAGPFEAPMTPVPPAAPAAPDVPTTRYFPGPEGAAPAPGANPATQFPPAPVETVVMARWTMLPIILLVIVGPIVAGITLLVVWLARRSSSSNWQATSSVDMGPPGKPREVAYAPPPEGRSSRGWIVALVVILLAAPVVLCLGCAGLFWVRSVPSPIGPVEVQSAPPPPKVEAYPETRLPYDQASPPFESPLPPPEVRIEGADSSP